jgi:PAS domain S-box-containing protein
LNDDFDIPRHLRQLMDQMSVFDDVVFVLTADLSVRAVNEQVEPLSGYRRAEFESDPSLWQSLIHSDDRETLYRLLQDAPVNGPAGTLDYRLRRADNSRRWVRAQVIATEVGDSHQRMFLVRNQDISDLKEMEVEASLAKEQAQLYLNLADVIMVALDTDQKITLINRKGCEVLGDTEENILGRNWFDSFVPMPDAIRVKETYGRLLTGELELVENFQNRIRTTQGEIRTIAWHNTLLRDRDGRVIGTLSSGEDITARMTAEDALRDREDRLRALVEGTHSCIMFIENRVIKYANPGASAIFEFSRDELVGADTSILYTSREHYESAGEMLYGALKRDGFWQGQFAFRKKDGSTLWIDSYVTLLAGGGIVWIGHDVTERINSSAALQEREARLSSIFRASPAGIGVLINRVFAEVNDRFCDMVGYTPDEVKNRSARLIYPSDEEFERVGAVKYQQIAEYGTGTMETQWRRKDGTVIDVLLSSTPLDPGDLSHGVTFTALDISERKAAERALVRSEEMLAKAQQIASAGSFEWDMVNNVHIASDEAFHILGVKPGDISASFESFQKFVHREDVDLVRQALQTAFVNGSFDIEHRIIRADGVMRFLHTQGRLIRDTGGRPIMMNGIFQDVSDRKEAERALVEKHIALKEVLNQIAADSDAVKQQIAANIEAAILPTLMKIKDIANPTQLKLLETLQKDFQEISSPFLDSLKSRQARLTPRETEISRLIKNGMSSKEIAETLSLSLSTVHKHREMIRKKLGLANEDINLATFLQSL